MTDIHSTGIQGPILTSASDGYEKAILRVSQASVLNAGYVVFPTSISDISLAIKFALSQQPPLEIAVKGGGAHSSTASSSEGGLVVDLSKLNKVTLSADKRSVAVQGGAVWGDVYSVLAVDELVVVGGNVWFVGVGGLLTGGGYSSISGKYGLGVDNILGATVVLSDGRIVQCNKEEEPDLFWAIRGGTNQFGIVAEFVLKTHPDVPALAGALAYPGTQLAKVLEVTHNFLKIQPPSSHLVLLFTRSPPHFYPGVVILPYIQSDTGDAEKLIAPFRTEVTPVFEQVRTVPNFNAVSHGSDAAMANSPPRILNGGAMFSELWDDVAEKVFGEWKTFTETEDHKRTMVLWQFVPQAKIAEVGREETAFPVREPHYYVSVTEMHTLPESDDSAREWVTKITNFVKNANAEKSGKRLATPTNFSLGPKYNTVEDVFGDNLSRLKKIKAIYDPKKVWNKGWVIEPDFQ
ncbi:FAD-binding domain-containing protein [Collybia nuda]|uniref:FAD-binding domain-containing protein n=1 Tax=Collybia nuda TaxID=64659 RepID=A0A9P6CIB9_9AGAR|nr:FAD-binding domain-containing protein [Collybia nuda]